MLAATLGALAARRGARPWHAQRTRSSITASTSRSATTARSRSCETIDYDFGPIRRHGIFRDIPTRLRYDDTYDRIYPLDVVEVRASEGTPAGYEVESAAGGITRIRIGDADTDDHRPAHATRSRTGRGGTERVRRPRRAVLERDRRRVVGADRAGDRHACTRPPNHAGRLLPGVRGLDPALPCARAPTATDGAVRPDRRWSRTAGVTVVVGLPKGVVARARARCSRNAGRFGRAFARDPGDPRGHGRARPRRDRRRDRARLGPRTRPPVPGLAGGPGDGQSRRASDRRCRSARPTTSAPVEFAPPEDLRPGQMGTLLDERANVLDVTATIVDLAVRGYLLIQEIPKEGWFGKPDWRLIRLEQARRRPAHVRATPPRRAVPRRHRGHDLGAEERRSPSGSTASRSRSTPTP